MYGVYFLGKKFRSGHVYFRQLLVPGIARDGNGYPRPVTRWVFSLLGSRSRLNFVPTGLLLGQMLYPMGLRVWV
jgi:hypothetical protein